MFFSKHPWHPWNDDRLFTAAKKSWSSQYCRLLLRWHHDIDSQQPQSVCSSQPNVYSGEIARSCSKTCRNIWYAYDYVRYFHITSYNISQAYFAWWYFPMKWMNVPYFPIKGGEPRWIAHPPRLQHQKEVFQALSEGGAGQKKDTWDGSYSYRMLHICLHSMIFICIYIYTYICNIYIHIHVYMISINYLASI